LSDIALFEMTILSSNKNYKNIKNKRKKKEKKKIDSWSLNYPKGSGGGFATLRIGF
jgi:hypothetical protein